MASRSKAKYCRCGRVFIPDEFVRIYLESDPEKDNDPVKKAIIEDNVDELISALDSKTGGDGNQRPFTISTQFALRWSCRFGKFNCATALLDRHIVGLFVQGQFGDTPLHIACDEGNVKVAKYIIKLAKKENVVEKLLEAVDSFGNTPLHSAAEGGSCDIIVLLLNHGADPCKRNLRNLLPLHQTTHGSLALKLLSLAARKGRLVRGTLPPSKKKRKDDQSLPRSPIQD